MKRIITEEMLCAFRAALEREERSASTVDYYTRDARSFAAWAAGREIDRDLVILYKHSLKATGRKAESLNTVFSALNSLFRFLGWEDCRIKSLRCQKRLYSPEEKELTQAEYERLVHTAMRGGNERLSLLLQTLCGTGIRVSELEFITVEAARSGEALVNCKGKTRPVLIVKALRKRLLSFAQKRGIESGPIFIARTGRPLNRSNIWREMKALCAAADVVPDKVFPHNLRHLFARVFYRVERDLAKLADVLGHSSIETTRIYIISTGAEHRALLERMKLII